MDHTRPFPPDRGKQEPALLQLRPLVGAWNLELNIRGQQPKNVWGLWSFFDWMEDGLFLVWRWGPARPDFPGGLFPSALSVIGYDDATHLFFIHYFDSRGVYRVLNMTLQDRVWKIWRESPGFSQRFTARIAEDNSMITGAWEKSSDGEHWEHDFEMVFSKALSINTSYD